MTFGLKCNAIWCHDWHARIKMYCHWWAHTVVPEISIQHHWETQTGHFGIFIQNLFGPGAACFGLSDNAIGGQDWHFWDFPYNTYSVIWDPDRLTFDSFTVPNRPFRDFLCSVYDGHGAARWSLKDSVMGGLDLHIVFRFALIMWPSRRQFY